MRKVGLWKVAGSKPEKLEDSEVHLERHLEDWIAADPALLQSGLVIVGRQISLEGGRLDLLGLDPQGRWAVIEVKKGALRREAIAQAIDYASCLEELTTDEFRAPLDDYLATRDGRSLDALLEERESTGAVERDQRELVLFVVGTGRTPGLDRIGSFLAARLNLPLSIVTFDVFVLDEQRSILAREITEPEGVPAPVKKPVQTTVEKVVQLAERQGVGKVFRDCLTTAGRLGLYPRAWKTSIMFAPQANRTRALFTVWASPHGGKARLWIGDDVFSEFFGVPGPAIARHLGPAGWRTLSQKEVEGFLAGLEALLGPVVPE